jgi:SAM-dependent methyltransferase
VEWGAGRYESIAAGLMPAAYAVVDAAAPGVGEHVVDVGSGTGNASLLVAERGAQVTGIDPAERLVHVASELASARGLDATFVTGDAAALPIADASADAVISVFGVIFAPDPAASIAELARVTAPGGRIVLSAWEPAGALFEIAGLRRRAVMGDAPPPAGPPPFAWHDGDALAVAFGPQGFDVSLSQETLAFTAASVDEFTATEFGDHPMWLAARVVLEQRGEWDAVVERATAVLAGANEDPAAFRITSPYVVATLRRDV